MNSGHLALDEHLFRTNTMLFGKIFTTFAAFATTIGLYHRGIIPGPSFNDRSIRTSGHVLDVVESPDFPKRRGELTVEFYVNDTKLVKDLPISKLLFVNIPIKGENVTLCYSLHDIEDIAVENGKLTCEPLDPITTVAVYTVHTLIFAATLCAAFLAFSFPTVPVGSLLLGTPFYLVTLGISGDPGLALSMGLCLGAMALNLGAEYFGAAYRYPFLR